MCVPHSNNDEQIQKLANELIVLLRRTSQKELFLSSCLVEMPPAVHLYTIFPHEMQRFVVGVCCRTILLYLYVCSLSAVDYLSFLILRRKNEEKLSQFIIIFYSSIESEWRFEWPTLCLLHSHYTNPFEYSHLSDQVVRFVSKRQQNDKSPKRSRRNSWKWAIRKRK